MSENQGKIAQNSVPRVTKSVDELKLYDDFGTVLANHGQLSELDLVSLKMLADTYALYLRVKKQWEQEGRPVVEEYDSRGDILTRPSVLYKEMINLQKEVLVLLREMHMSPKSRASLQGLIIPDLNGGPKKRQNTIEDFLDI